MTAAVSPRSSRDRAGETLSDNLLRAQRGNLRGVVTERAQHFVGMLAEFRAEPAGFARRCREFRRNGRQCDVDFVARRQGGEFLFIFPETPKESGFIVVERIRQKLAQTSFTESYGLETAGEFNITASFGVAGLPTDTMNADILHDAAEAALDRAKQSADTVVLFDASMAERAD